MTTTTTPMTTAGDPVDIDIVLDLRIPVFSVPSNFINVFRDALRSFPLPHIIDQSLTVISVNFTTGCYPNFTGGLQCHCEEQFAWSCDKCNSYGACSNATSQTCGCINGLPSDGEFCEPITNISQCPISTPGMTTTTLMTTTAMTTTAMTTMAMTTTAMTTTAMTTTAMTTTAMTTTAMTTAITTTAAPITTVTSTAQVRNLSFTLDIEFKDSFNDISSQIYKDVNDTIQKQCREHISTLETAELRGFRSGSTIAEYTIRATSFQATEIERVMRGIFSQLAEKYPVLFDSETHLHFTPSQVFFGRNVTVTCGPPPENLNFNTNWTAEWRRNNQLILKDNEHVFSVNKENGVATLTVSRFFPTDNGDYECKLINRHQTDKSVFRQKSNGRFLLREIPLIRVTPVRKNVKCEVGKLVPLECSVDSPYNVEFKGIPEADTGQEITYEFEIPDCDNEKKNFICQEKDFNFVDFSKEITLLLSTNTFVCKNDPVFGDGAVDDKAIAPCDSNKVGELTAVCRENGKWEDRQDNCILRPVQELFEQSQNLNNNSLPGFLEQLTNVTVNFTTEVVNSSANINAIVDILNNVANTLLSSNISINETLMENILLTAGVLTTDGAKRTWEILNTNDTSNSPVTGRNSPTAKSVSSTFLQSLENITRRLTNDSFGIVTPSILLNKTTFTDTFNADINSSVEIDIQESDGGSKSITVITFASMDNVLPARDEANSTQNIINGRVVLVQSSGTISNVSFTYEILNETLANPQCVFWNFSLFEGLGGWDDEGCMLVKGKNFTCNCNHLTSFSILMSPHSPDDPVLNFITYIGVSISMASLVICLIIEAVIWRKIRRNNTSYLRHVSIVNIAASLLVANIWFIIGAFISESDNSTCSAATFFIHFFYLALFFWMLASALLLFYRTVSVFDGGLSKKSMLAIGFSLGYGAPLIIAFITVAATAPSKVYIRGTGVCWLNWYESKALLAFVIPALLIVAINLVILLVVIYKMLRRRAVGDTAQAAERNVLVVIARSLAVLTPFFGLTWGLGVGTMISPHDRGIHISFAFFNSLQGFFILVFGTLLDKKVRSELAIMSQTSGSGTRSTSAGISSSSGLGFLRNWRRGRDGYNMSSSATGESHSFNNT